MDSMQDRQRKLDRGKQVLQRLMMTADGEHALLYLDAMFGREVLIGRDTHDTYFNLGVFEVVNHLKQLGVES